MFGYRGGLDGEGNRSFLEGIFPTDFKLARVVPNFKSGDSASFSNYRPISVQSLFPKIYEKLLYKCIFFFSNRTIYKHQFEFRETPSTHQAISSLVEKITESWDTSDMVIGVFLDKALDTVL